MKEWHFAMTARKDDYHYYYGHPEQQPALCHKGM